MSANQARSSGPEAEKKARLRRQVLIIENGLKYGNNPLPDVKDRVTFLLETELFCAGLRPYIELVAAEVADPGFKGASEFDGLLIAARPELCRVHHPAIPWQFVDPEELDPPNLYLGFRQKEGETEDEVVARVRARDINGYARGEGAHEIPPELRLPSLRVSAGPLKGLSVQFCPPVDGELETMINEFAGVPTGPAYDPDDIEDLMSDDFRRTWESLFTMPFDEYLEFALGRPLTEDERTGAAGPSDQQRPDQPDENPGLAQSGEGSGLTTGGEGASRTASDNPPTQNDNHMIHDDRSNSAPEDLQSPHNMHTSQPPPSYDGAFDEPDPISGGNHSGPAHHVDQAMSTHEPDTMSTHPTNFRSQHEQSNHYEQHRSSPQQDYSNASTHQHSTAHPRSDAPNTQSFDAHPNARPHSDTSSSSSDGAWFTTLEADRYTPLPESSSPMRPDPDPDPEPFKDARDVPCSAILAGKRRALLKSKRRLPANLVDALANASDTDTDTGPDPPVLPANVDEGPFHIVPHIGPPNASSSFQQGSRVYPRHADLPGYDLVPQTPPRLRHVPPAERPAEYWEAFGHEFTNIPGMWGPCSRFVEPKRKKPSAGSKREAWEIMDAELLFGVEPPREWGSGWIKGWVNRVERGVEGGREWYVREEEGEGGEGGGVGVVGVVDGFYGGVGKEEEGQVGEGEGDADGDVEMEDDSFGSGTSDEVSLLPAP